MRHADALETDFRFSAFAVQDVPISSIDRSDVRFQHRLSYGVKDLVQTLREDGQQVPVMLWSDSGSLKIIDGFRRIAALVEIGVVCVQAIVRDDIDEQRAFALSFIENVRRKSFTTLDKAHAVCVSIHQRRATSAQVAEELGLSERQVYRYLSLLKLSPELSEALRRGQISMAHAAVLSRAQIEDLASVLAMIREEDLGAEELKRRLRPRHRARPRGLLTKDGDGFRLRAVRFRPSMTPREKRGILEVLESAAEAVRSELRCAGRSARPLG